MKYCSRCGTENDVNAGFCKSCGNSLNTELNVQNNVQKKEGLGVASLVIGIISLVFSFIFNIFTIPLAIIGLILGIVNKATKGKKFAGIILNIISIIVSTIVFILWMFVIGSVADSIDTDSGKDFLNRLYNELERETSDNYVEGKYNCKSFDGSGEGNDYIVRFELDDDMTFLWGKYNDTKDNYVKGTYEFTDLEKTNESGEYKYYNIKLDGEEYYNKGEEQEEKYSSEYEFGITAIATKKQGILMNVKNYNMYYCYEE